MYQLKFRFGRGLARTSRVFALANCAILLAFAPAISQAQSQNATPAASPQTTAPAPPADSSQQDPLKRPITDQQRLKQQKQLHQELEGPYKKWLNEDVRWIITDDEIKAFKSLSNNEERDAFIENFWERRNPEPGSPNNEFREEHYRRIQYANDHFAAGKPGWETDRGHIYIVFGPPDDKQEHPTGGSMERPLHQGGGETNTFPYETWHYKFIDGIGSDIQMEFVDTCQCGDYHMTIDSNEKDAFLHASGAGSTLWEQMGLAQKQNRYTGGVESLNPSPMGNLQTAHQFDNIYRMAKLMATQPVKFKDMDEYLVTHKLITGPVLPFEVRTDYAKVTNDLVLVPVTIQIRNQDITWKDSNQVTRGPVNILGHVTNITGHIVATFEDTVDDPFPTELKQKKLETSEVYWKALPLAPGHYRLDIVVKDVNNPDHVGVYSRGIEVPKFDDDHIGSSALILADKMERVPSKEIGTGSFVIGNTYIRPRVGPTPAASVSFRRDQKLNFWMQVYNLGIDDKTKQNSATIEYQIVNLADNKSILDSSETSSQLGPNSDELTLEKSVSLASLQPGKYQVTIKVNDGVSKQQLAQSAPFTVE
jgi:GWxTD domain-containing protein